MCFEVKRDTRSTTAPRGSCGATARSGSARRTSNKPIFIRLFLIPACYQRGLGKSADCAQKRCSEIDLLAYTANDDSDNGRRRLVQSRWSGPDGAGAGHVRRPQVVRGGLFPVCSWLAAEGEQDA